MLLSDGGSPGLDRPELPVRLDDENEAEAVAERALEFSRHLALDALLNRAKALIPLLVVDYAASVANRAASCDVQDTAHAARHRAFDNFHRFSSFP